jgi:hypothetical protein
MKNGVFEHQRLAEFRLDGVANLRLVIVKPSFTTLADIRKVYHERQLACAFTDAHGTIVMWSKGFASRISIVPKSRIESRSRM